MVTYTYIPYHYHNVDQWTVDESHETYHLAYAVVTAIMSLREENEVRRFRFPLMLIYNDRSVIEYCQLRAVNVEDTIKIDVVRI